MSESDASEPAAVDLAAVDLAGEVAAVAAGYRLALASARYRGRIGQRRGVGPGSSLEFHDFRDYAPGDDLRHVDWRGYARTDQLRVRLHESEVAPIVEVLLDTSASMATTAQKQRCVTGLAQAFSSWARQEGSTGRALALGGEPIDLASVSFTGRGDPEPPAVRLRPGSVRILLTDALWSVDPEPLLRRLAADASRFVCVQVLDPGERVPAASGAVTLVDCESGARAALRLDARAVAIYRERLERLCAALRSAVLGLGGKHVLVEAAALPTVCRRDLLPAGIVGVA